MNDEIDGKSLDLKAQRLAQLREIFPEFVSEGRLDLSAVKEVLGDDDLTNPDHYELSWAGKAEARREIQKQTTATLVPDKTKSINFETADNTFIEGENLEVLRTLQKAYFGKVKMIYIDPPYNTGGDSFIYPDDYAERLEEYEKRTGSKNGGGFLNKLDLFKKNTKENGQYHSVWLSMMYPRLYLARNLLREDGVIFVSIDENEVHNLRHLMNEIFGEENFRNCFALRRYDKNLNRQFIEQGLKSFNVGFEYVLCYSRSDRFAFDPVYRASSEDRQNFGYWKGFWNGADRKTMRYDILGFTPTEGQWKWSKDKALTAVENYKTFLAEHSATKTLEEYWIETGKKLSFIRRNPNGQGKNKGVENWIPPSDGTLRNTNWTDLFASKSEGEIASLFDFAKNVEVIRNLIIASGCETGDIVLDFFAGSGTTAQAVLELNRDDGQSRSFLCVQMEEAVAEDSEAYKKGYRTISEVCAERIRGAMGTLSDRSNGKLDFQENDQNLGFRFYRLNYSNFKKWNSDLVDKETLLKQIEIFKEPLASQSADSFELLAELLLKSGIPLSSKTERKQTVTGTPFYVVEGHVVYALDSLSDDLLGEIEALKPTMFVTLGNLFTGEKADETMTNWKLQLQEAGIEFKLI